MGLLAHLSQRLIGELIEYQWSVVRPSSSTMLRQLFSETAWPIKVKLYIEPPWIGGTKFCSRRVGNMTKMAATPIYGKVQVRLGDQDYSCSMHAYHVISTTCSHAGGWGSTAFADHSSARSMLVFTQN